MIGLICFLGSYAERVWDGMRLVVTWGYHVRGLGDLYLSYLFFLWYLTQCIVGYTPFYADEPVMTCRKILRWQHYLEVSLLLDFLWHFWWFVGFVCCWVRLDSRFSFILLFLPLYWFHAPSHEWSQVYLYSQKINDYWDEFIQ